MFNKKCSDMMVQLTSSPVDADDGRKLGGDIGGT